VSVGGPHAPAHTWRPLDLIELGSEPPMPPDLGELFYCGKRHVLSGEDDAGKTMLLAGISADELRGERGVVWIDTDAMGASAILERLRGFGAEDEAIRSLFAYLQPEEALTDPARDDVISLLSERKARLLVIDAFNASLVLHGNSPSKTEDVEAFWQRVVAPFCNAGAAVVLPDHVVKKREERGRYAYGSERKVTGCDVHLGLQVIDPFGRGRRGRAKITVQRDRIGFLQRPSPGLFVLDSDPETGRLAWQIEESRERGEKGEWRPTGYMEKVSRYLEPRVAEPPSIAQIRDGVPGGTELKRQAVEMLIRDGYAVEIPGSRNARLVKSVRPYREADEWQESEAES
jgi:AAA domain